MIIFNTDTGDKQKGCPYSTKQIRFPYNTFNEVLATARTRKGNPRLIVKTSAYGKKTGSYYIKAFNIVDIDKLKDLLKHNATLGLYSRRTAFLI